MLGDECSPYDDDDYDHGDHDGADDHDEIEDFLFESRHSLLWLVGELCDFAKDGVVARGDDDACARSGDAVSALEANASGLEIVVIC